MPHHNTIGVWVGTGRQLNSNFVVLNCLFVGRALLAAAWRALYIKLPTRLRVYRELLMTRSSSARHCGGVLTARCGVRRGGGEDSPPPTSEPETPSRARELHAADTREAGLAERRTSGVARRGRPQARAPPYSAAGPTALPNSARRTASRVPMLYNLWDEGRRSGFHEGRRAHADPADEAADQWRRERGRDLALRTAETDKPQGPKYRKAMGAWLCCYGFDRIDGGDRSRLIQCYDHLDGINAWRSALPAEKRKKLNHPGTVLTHWKRSLRRPPPPPSIPTITIDMVLAWAATAAHEDKCRVAAALRIDVGAEVVKRAVAQERSSAQKQARKFIEGVRLALLTNEAPARQVEAVKAMVDAYEARGTRALDWCNRTDQEASSFIKDKPKQSTSPVPTALAPPPPTKH